MNSREIGEMKYRLLLKMIENEAFVALMDPNKNAEYPEDLIYTSLFPYGRIPDTEQNAGVYVTVMMDVPSISKKNDLVRDINLRMRVYCHETLMRVPGKNATRIDLVAAEIDEMINESYDFGIGYVTLVKNTEHTLDSKHQFRELIFRTDALNSKRNGARQWDP